MRHTRQCLQNNEPQLRRLNTTPPLPDSTECNSNIICRLTYGCAMCCCCCSWCERGHMCQGIWVPQLVVCDAVKLHALVELERLTAHQHGLQHNTMNSYVTQICIEQYSECA
jgi:hypothetical protein